MVNLLHMNTFEANEFLSITSVLLNSSHQISRKLKKDWHKEIDQ